MTYSFKPRKVVKSFRDLEVYQVSLELSVLVVKRLKNSDYLFKDRVVECSLDIPLTMARAHSSRFDADKKGIHYLEDAMRKMNEMVVYLEQVRELSNDNDTKITVNKIMARYSNNRSKTFRLYRSWKKFLNKDG